MCILWFIEAARSYTEIVINRNLSISRVNDSATDTQSFLFQLQIIFYSCLKLQYLFHMRKTDNKESAHRPNKQKKKHIACDECCRVCQKSHALTCAITIPAVDWRPGLVVSYSVLISCFLCTCMVFGEPLCLHASVHTDKNSCWI